LGKILRIAGHFQGPHGDMIKKIVSGFTGVSSDGPADTAASEESGAAPER
jgi:hypothetical protein